ncbi:MAG: DUF763 domain-containing protein [Elusimicrobiota bacterium]|nr:DUF763 domain-containing protein [Endomicrobiia bacterium]MDW8165780.1 DUF763 domain-containing protein [Elusimicrobiota bacterium]
MNYNIAELPLHTGKAPKWLFERQKKLLFEICKVVILEFGTKELLKRLSDPVWFQVLGCISGFDWHSSGVTTTVTAAIKETFKNKQEYGLFIFGGKGKTALNTPKEILSSKIENPEIYITISKLTAKVDNSCIQDGYQIYHHTIFVDKDNNWCVIQQGMNTNLKYARRYHWFNKLTTSKEENFIISPHTGIASQEKQKITLNFIDDNSEGLQRNILEYINLQKPEKIIEELKKITSSEPELFLPERHYITKQDFEYNKLYKILCKIKDFSPSNFKDFILIEGLGPKTLLALGLISEVIYGYPISTKDPARFSFAFGGKDGHPYPVDKKNYDTTLNLFKTIIDKAQIEGKEKLKILKFLSSL